MSNEFRVLKLSDDIVGWVISIWAIVVQPRYYTTSDKQFSSVILMSRISSEFYDNHFFVFNFRFFEQRQSYLFAGH